MLLQLSKTVKQSPKSPQIFENNGAFCADRPFSKNRSETNCQKSFVFNQLVSELQSYILSTTTETRAPVRFSSSDNASIVHPFNNNWNISSYGLAVFTFLSFNRTSFQQQLKLFCFYVRKWRKNSFNRTSFQQQLKLTILDGVQDDDVGFNRTSFQQQLKPLIVRYCRSLEICFNRTSFQQQLKRVGNALVHRLAVLQSYILSTTTETCELRQFLLTLTASIVHPFNNNWNELLSRKHCAGLASIVHPFNNNWNWILCVDLWSIRLGFNRTSFQQQLKPKSSISTKILSKLQSYILSTTTETSGLR